MRNKRVIFHLLGPPDISVIESNSQQTIKIPRRRSRALLYYMVSTHAPQPRERLLNLLCGEMDEEGARHAFKTLLAEVRAHLRTVDDSIEWIISDGDRLTFNPLAPVWLDTELFERDAVTTSRNLNQALKLYGGDFLDGFFLKDSPDFDTWMRSTRDHFRHLYRVALRHLAELYEADQQVQEAISCMQRLLNTDPFAEDAHAYLMQLYWRAGDRTEALRQYEKLSALLTSEFSVQPSPATQMLYRQIAAPDALYADRAEQNNPQSRGAVQATPRSISYASHTSHIPPTPFSLSGVAAHAGGQEREETTRDRTTHALSLQVPLIGRQRELAWLREHLLDSDEAAVLLLLWGEAGSGKTRLLQEVTGVICEDWLQLTCTCRKAEHTLSYRCIAEVLRSPAVRELIAQVELPQVWRNQLMQLVPDLFPGERATMLGLEPLLLSDALVALLNGLASAHRPLLIVFDDLHYADEQTLALLAYSMRHLHDVFVLATCTAHDGRLATRLDEWGDASLTHRCALSPLAATDIEQLVSVLVPDLATETGTRMGNAATRWNRRELSAWCYARSEGNPLLATYWLLALHTYSGVALAQVPLPEVLAHIVHEQISALSAQARTVLDASAYLGSPFPLSRVAHMLELDVHTALIASTQLVEQGILRACREDEVEQGILRACREDESETARSWNATERQVEEPDNYIFVHQVVRMVVLSEMSRAHRSLFELAIRRLQATEVEENEPG